MARITFRSFWSFMARRTRKSNSHPAAGKRPKFGSGLPLSLQLLENRWLPSAVVVTDKPDYDLLTGR